MADEKEPEDGSQSMGKVENTEDRGSVGGPGSKPGEVAPGDAHGSQQGAGAALSGADAGSPSPSGGSAAGESGEHADEAGSEPTHVGGVGKGEESGKDKEPGRYDTGTTGAGRPAGGSTGRDSTGINPGDQDPIDPESPTMPTP